jgi:hypothetical protein
VAAYDPELPSIWEAHIIFTVEDTVRRLELDNWVAIANTTSLPLGKSWMQLGFFEKKAMVKAVNGFISEREKKTNEKTKQIEKAMEDRTPHRSLFHDIGLPKTY